MKKIIIFQKCLQTESEDFIFSRFLGFIEFHTHLLTPSSFQHSAMSFGGFLPFGGRNLGEIMVLDNSFQSIFKSLFKDLFECHYRGIEISMDYGVSSFSLSPCFSLSVLSFDVGAGGSIKRMHCRG
jgi:hypothetical protein